jgi:hypothetical protein
MKTQDPTVTKQSTRNYISVNTGLPLGGLEWKSEIPYAMGSVGVTRTMKILAQLCCPSLRLQSYTESHLTCRSGRDAMQPVRTSHTAHRTRMEHARKQRTHGRDHVRGVSGPRLLHRQHWRSERVRLHPFFILSLDLVYMIWFTWHSFAAGKGSALVIDVGSNMASVAPIVDGFVLRKGVHTAYRASTSAYQSCFLCDHRTRVLCLAQVGAGALQTHPRYTHTYPSRC